MTNPRLARRGRRSLITVIPLIAVLLAASAFAYVSVTSKPSLPTDLTPITVEQAVRAYRANPGPLRTDIPGPDKPPPSPEKSLRGFKPPKPGVYTYATNGGDWVEYKGDKYTRTFPSITPATVRDGDGCMWELYFQPAKEYTDAHRQCSTRGAFLCMAHFSDITFGPQHDARTHRCKPPMLQVGGKVVGPGGVEETTCKAEDGSSALIKIKFLESGSVTVGGERREAYRVRMETTLTGMSKMEGSGVADVWFDAETGAYLKLYREMETRLKLSDKSSVAYKVRATYQLQSLTPQV